MQVNDKILTILSLALMKLINMKEEVSGSIFDKFETNRGFLQDH